jgi:hypothetical protein
MPKENAAKNSYTRLFSDRSPADARTSQGAPESQGYCVKLASSGYEAPITLEGASVAAVLLEQTQEGMDAEAMALPYQAVVSPVADFPAFSLFRDSRANSLAGRRIRDEERTVGTAGAD